MIANCKNPCSYDAQRSADVATWGNARASLRVAATLWLLLAVVPVRADESLANIVLPGESPSAAQRLESARKLVRDGQFAEAVDEYQRLLREAGDKLAPLSPRHSVEARWLCHLDLASLPPAGLHLYRNRVDAQAHKWFQQGAATRDVALLRRVVNEAFCSRYGDQALDLLGDLAFERGQFEESERWWRRIAPPALPTAAPKPPAGRMLALVFPDPQLDVARIRAKQLLARIFQGNEEFNYSLAAEIQAFQQQHPTAAGRLAGHTGNYAALLQNALHGAIDVPQRPAAWTTFAGSPSRNHVLPPEPRDPNRLARLVRRWRFNLETQAPLDDNEPPPDKVVTQSTAARSLAFQPVIAGEQVLVADARRVVAYDLHTGKAQIWYDSVARNIGANPDLTLPARPDLRYTLTVAEDCVLARLGVQCFGPGKDAQESESFLVCLNLRPDARGERLRWLARPDGGKPGAVFEGTPVVGDGRVYVAVTRFTAGRNVTSIHCYPLQVETTPLLRWRQDVCETPELTGKQERCRHHLLTLAGPNVVYCSHSGAIVALDAVTGRQAWGVRYPSHGLAVDEQPSPRDLAPCVYAGGRLYAAPADHDRLLCLDPATGQVLWERDRIEVVHLLGVARNRLIFTTRQGIRAVRADTGGDKDGWMQPDLPDNGKLPPFGRGFLAGAYVFWPTRQRLYVLHQVDGQQPDDLNTGTWQDLPGGNLVHGDGCLAVAGEKVLTVYVPAAWLRAEREQQTQHKPRSAVAHYQLALAEADADLHGQALASLERAERVAEPGECWQGASVRQLVRAARFQVLLRQAEQADAEQRWEDAGAALTRAAQPDQPVPCRLQALWRLGRLWDLTNKPGRAVAVWQGILRDEALQTGRLPRGTRLLRRDGEGQIGGLNAAAAIDDLIRRSGAEVYAEAEKQARALLDSATGEQRQAVLERLAREFPNAAVTRSALHELARLHEQDGRWGAAAAVYRLLLERKPAKDEQAALLGELARAYERQQCWEAARDTWQRLERHQGERTVAAIDPDHPIGEVVARELRKPPYHSGVLPDLPLPLTQGWQHTLAVNERLLVPEYPAPDKTTCPRPDMLLFARGNELLCLEAATGRQRWRCTLPFVATWAGRCLDLVLAGGPNGLCGVRLDDGVVLWSFVPEAESSLSAFHVTMRQVFFLQGQRRLVSLEAANGACLWSVAAPSAELGLPYPSGRFHPHYHPGNVDWLVAQTAGGKLWVLDNHDGHRVHELETSREPWPQPPLLLAPHHHFCLVIGPRDVVLLDPGAGEVVDRPEIPGATTLAGRPPQVVGDARGLLLITFRNYGPTLQRLNPLDGAALWPDERPIGSGPIVAAGMTLDTEAVYFASGDDLRAHALVNGKLLWHTSLPRCGASWHTLRTGRYLVAYPTEVGARTCHCRQLFGVMDLKATFPLHERQTLGFPVLVCAAATGRLVQRLNLTAAPPEAAVRGAFAVEGLVVPVVGVQREPVQVQLSPRGLVIVAADRVSGRTIQDADSGR